MGLISKENCLILEGRKQENYEHPDLEVSLGLLHGRDAISVFKQANYYEILRSDVFGDQRLPKNKFEQAEKTILERGGYIGDALDMDHDFRYGEKEKYKAKFSSAEWEKEIERIKTALMKQDFYTVLRERVQHLRGSHGPICGPPHPTSIQPYGFVGFMELHEASLVFDKDDCFMLNMITFTHFLKKVYDGVIYKRKVYDGNGNRIDSKRLESVFEDLISPTDHNLFHHGELIDAELVNGEEKRMIHYDHRVGKDGIVRPKFSERFLDFGPKSYFDDSFELGFWLKHQNPQGFPTEDVPHPAVVDKKKDLVKNYFCLRSAHPQYSDKGFYVFFNSQDQGAYGPEIRFTNWNSTGYNTEQVGVRPARIRRS